MFVPMNARLETPDICNAHRKHVNFIPLSTWLTSDRNDVICVFEAAISGFLSTKVSK